MIYEEMLARQQAEANGLAHQRQCPHCHQHLSLLDALSMVRGHGYSYHIRIQLPNGELGLIPERDFSPQTMLWAEIEPEIEEKTQ